MGERRAVTDLLRCLILLLQTTRRGGIVQVTLFHMGQHQAGSVAALTNLPCALRLPSATRCHSDDLGPRTTYTMSTQGGSSSLPLGPGTNFTCTVGSDSQLTCQGMDGDASVTGTNSSVFVGVDFYGLASYAEGRLEIAMSFIIFLFGLYFMCLEAVQLVKLGAAAYFDSFWNFVDLASYAAAMVLAPCVLARYGMQDGGFVYALVSGGSSRSLFHTRTST